jgi:hypothetical protein
MGRAAWGVAARRAARPRRQSAARKGGARAQGGGLCQETATLSHSGNGNLTELYFAHVAWFARGRAGAR